VITSLDKRLLLQHLLGVDAEEYLRTAPHVLNQAQQSDYDALLQRRSAGEPVAKIIGKKAFWKHLFLTNRQTLDPRPESELIIEAVLRHRPDTASPYHFLDCGTGSGCLLLSLLHEYPNAIGEGVDILPEAIATANHNATRLGVENRSHFRTLRWTSLQKPLYDIIVSNPPYIPTCDIPTLLPDVTEYDPMEALDGGTDGLNAYRELFSCLETLMKPRAIFVCEIGVGQEADVVAIGKAASMKHRETIQDLADIPRVLVWERK
jgi:release factor glutamine methyltransferase